MLASLVTLLALAAVSLAAPAYLPGAVTAKSTSRESTGHRVLTFKPCDDGLVRRADGECVKPIIQRSIFVYDAPEPVVTYKKPSYIPTPKVNYNYVFVRTKNTIVEKDPIVVPPAPQKTLVYLLNKESEERERDVIQVKGEEENPEVYFVNYNSEENKNLPGGVDLQTALSQSSSFGGSSSVGESSKYGYRYPRPTYGDHGGEDDVEDEEEESESDESSESSESDSDEEDDEEESEEEDDEGDEKEEEEEKEEGLEGNKGNTGNEGYGSIDLRRGKSEDNEADAKDASAGGDKEGALETEVHSKREEETKSSGTSALKTYGSAGKSSVTELEIATSTQKTYIKPKRKGNAVFPPPYIV